MPGIYGIPTFLPNTDALQLAASGAVEVRVGELPSGLKGAVLDQCLPAQGGDAFSAGAAARGDTGALLEIRFFADDDCTAGLLEGLSLPLTPNDGDVFLFSWAPVLPAPVDARRVRLRLRRPSKFPGVARSEFDKVFLAPSLTPEPPPLEALPEVSVDDHTVQFRASHQGGVSPLTPAFRWEFGDGASAQGMEAFHTYSQAGSYLATLTVDTGFESTTVTLPVRISPEVPSLSPVGQSLLALTLFFLAFRLLGRRREAAKIDP